MYNNKNTTKIHLFFSKNTWIEKNYVTQINKKR